MKILLSLLVLGLLVLAACGGSGDNAAAPLTENGENGDGEQVVPSSGDTLASFFSQGVGVECSFDLPDGGRETIQFLGKKAHMTVTGPASQELISTEKAVYIRNDEPGCDWLALPGGEDEGMPTMEEDWDLTELERAYGILYSNVRCAKKRFSEADFTPSGKVCSMEEMMQGMGMS